MSKSVVASITNNGWDWRFSRSLSDLFITHNYSSEFPCNLAKAYAIKYKFFFLTYLEVQSFISVEQGC